MNKLSTKLVSQAVLAITQVLFPLITLPVVSEAIGAKGYGLVSFTDSIAQLTTLLSSAGIPLYGIREIAAHKNNLVKQSKIFSELFIIQLLLAIPAIIIVAILGFSLGMPHVLIIIAIANILFTSLTNEWFLQGNDLFNLIALRAFAIRLIGVALIIKFVNTYSDYVIYYLILVGMIVVTAIFNLKVVFAMVTIAKTSWTGIKSHFNKLGYVFGCYLLASLFAVTDSIMLGLISTEEAVGYYSFGYRIVRMASMFTISLGVVFIGRFAYLKSTDNLTKIKTLQDLSINITLFFSIPVMTYFFIFSSEIVSVLGKGNFEETILVFKILSFVPLLLGLSHFTGVQLLLSQSRESIYFKFLLLGLLINICAGLILIFEFSHLGAAISNVLAEGIISLGLLLYLFSTRELNLHQFKIQHIIPILITVPTSLILKSLQLPDLIVLSVSGIVFLSLYSILFIQLYKKLFAINLRD